MANRKSLPKKIRFEVFKRDSFTCQYCGRRAPEIVLHIDHIEPVAEGGMDDILNLITSCQECNLGKSDKRISDNSVIEKQRQQLDELQERKEQLEMMYEWQKGLIDLESQLVEQLAKFWSEQVPGYHLNDNGKRELQKLTNRFDMPEIMEAMRISTSQYLKSENGSLTKESVETAWSKVGGICNRRRLEKDKPYMKDLYYIRGILRNRLPYIKEVEAIELLESAFECDASIESLYRHAKKAYSWANWRDGMEDFIANQQLQHQKKQISQDKGEG